MRAIILAAGLGTRLRPLTNDTPKALVKVAGKPMLERQIEFLHEKGIEDITIVTGYLAHKFDYLKAKYDVKLVLNEKYDVYNNIYTMYKVKDILPGSYVIEGDIYMNNNVIDPNPKVSTYYSAFRTNFQNEWKLVTDENGRVTNIVVGDGENDHIMTGISYWSKEDGEYIVKELEQAIESGGFDELFWDDMVRNNFSNLNVYLHPLEEFDSFEIDSVDDLEKVEEIISKK
ncbi:sugar phosphate nucleotidyltransferase [Cytobacillus gottheilii]|uniref:sugar phosphate nucleotidyltransferase n=1 Tax=Cytobacillus gottheilii TaxID=859144 RepID=UPI0009B9E998|nr:sugar phosphate nucleotidyltransferase [Cytobacillus gottheilii]